MREIRGSLPDPLIILSNLIPEYLHNYWADSQDLNGAVFQLKRPFRRYIICALNRRRCPDRMGKQKTRQVPYLAFQNRYGVECSTVVIVRTGSIRWHNCIEVWNGFGKQNMGKPEQKTMPVVGFLAHNDCDMF